MKTNILKHSLIATAVIMTATGCTEGDKFDYDANVAYISGTEVTPVTKLVVEDTPSSQTITVSTASPVAQDTKVTLAIDPAAVDEYNSTHGTSFYSIPENAAVLETTEVTIPAGRSYSNPATVKVVSTEDFVEGRTYLVPVSIKNASGVDILTPSRTIFLQVARVLHFTALETSDPNLYSNFIFPENLKRELSNFTYEIKCYSQDWHHIARLCSFTSADEQRSSMLRFGENGYDINSLQWISPIGSIVSTTRFNTDQWYMISLTYDGSTLAMYVDGVKDVEAGGDGQPVDFQRFELGMSWTGYRTSQYFRGRIAEVRVWDRALSPGELQMNLCGVDPSSDGLVAYWKMNEGQGYIFHDATGHGYDMDWSNTCREINEGDGLSYNLDYSSAVKWDTSDNNRCNE